MKDTKYRDVNDDKKPKIKEAIVVEGRDDTLAVSKAVNAITIETHGFGLRCGKFLIRLIEKGV